MGMFEDIVKEILIMSHRRVKAVARGGATGACAPPFKKKQKQKQKKLFPL